MPKSISRKCQFARLCRWVRVCVRKPRGKFNGFPEVILHVKIKTIHNGKRERERERDSEREEERAHEHGKTKLSALKHWLQLQDRKNAYMLQTRITST